MPRPGRADPDLDKVRLEAIRAQAVSFDPAATWPSAKTSCNPIHRDAASLLSQLELQRREPDATEIDPALADPTQVEQIATNIADALAVLLGTTDTEGPCGWNATGNPNAFNAAAVLAYTLHRHGDSWPSAGRAHIRDVILALPLRLPSSVAFRSDNVSLPSITAFLLAADLLEGAPRDAALAKYREELRSLTLLQVGDGGTEVNSPNYTSFHLPALAFLTSLHDDEARTVGRTLLETQLIQMGLLYVPGRGLGAPHGRDYGGGAVDVPFTAQTIQPLIADPLYLANPDWRAGAWQTVATASCTDYETPAVIRSLFVDKGDGYEAWSLGRVQPGIGNFPGHAFDFDGAGPRGYVSPFHVSMLPRGLGGIGLAYGTQQLVIGSSAEAVIAQPWGGWARFYQYVPAVDGPPLPEGRCQSTGAAPDRTHSGATLAGAGADPCPDDFVGEAYDYQRHMVHRTAILLWNPRGVDGQATRRYPDTRAHYPQCPAGEDCEERVPANLASAKDWWVYRFGEAYLAIHPIGTPVELERGRTLTSQFQPDDNARSPAWDDGHAFTYLRFEGNTLSGAVVEVATIDDFATIDDYAADLAGRAPSVGIAAPRCTIAECVAVLARTASGDVEEIGLDYIANERWIGDGPNEGVASLDHGFLEAPWVSADPVLGEIRIARDCFPPRVYKTGSDFEIHEEAPPGSCMPDTSGAGGSGGGASGSGGNLDPGVPGDETNSSGCACSQGKPSTPGDNVGAAFLLSIALVGVARTQRRRGLARGRGNCLVSKVSA